MTLTARQARALDPLEFTLRKIRADAGIYIHRARKLIDDLALDATSHARQRESAQRSVGTQGEGGK